MEFLSGSYTDAYLCGRAAETGPRRLRVSKLLFLQIFQCHLQMRLYYDLRPHLDYSHLMNKVCTLS